MGKKVKKRKNPPLSTLDKTIYYLCIFLSIFLGFLILICFFISRSAIALSDESVIAYTADKGFLWVLPFMLTVTISLFGLVSGGLVDHMPIFGNKKINYGEHPWAYDCYPLFDKRRKKYRKPSAKRLHRKIITILCIVILISLCFVPLGLFKRDCLNADNSITSYNSFNKKSDIVYTQENFSHLTIDAYYYKNTNRNWVANLIFPRKYSFRLKIKTSDGNSFTFKYGDFDNKSLDKMLEIKSLFDADSVTVTDADDVDKIIENLNLTTQEAEKLNQLFNK